MNTQMRIALLAVSLAVTGMAASPDEERAKREARFRELCQQPGVSERKTIRLTYPTREQGTQWLPATTFLKHEVEHRRSSGGNFELRAIAPTRDGPHTRFAVIIRFLEMAPAIAYSKTERAFAEQHRQRLNEDGRTYFLEPNVQVDTGHFRKDEPTGKLLARVVTWGPTWRLHERAYEVEMILLP